MASRYSRPEERFGLCSAESLGVRHSVLGVRSEIRALDMAANHAFAIRIGHEPRRMSLSDVIPLLVTQLFTQQLPTFAPLLDLFHAIGWRLLQ